VWILRTIATVAILLLVPSASRAEERRTCIYTDDRFLHVECRIDEPYVGLRFTPYPDIPFLPGDSVSVDAGGRVQIGGTWATWKLYVNPQDDVSNNLYHGLIYLPVPGKVFGRMGSKRLSHARSKFQLPRGRCKWQATEGDPIQRARSKPSPAELRHRTRTHK